MKIDCICIGKSTSTATWGADGPESGVGVRFPPVTVITGL
jgi:hypothetical protein